MVSNIFYFHPYLGKIPILTNIFSDGLKPPTSFSHHQSLLMPRVFNTRSIPRNQHLLPSVIVLFFSKCNIWGKNKNIKTSPNIKPVSIHPKKFFFGLVVWIPRDTPKNPNPFHFRGSLRNPNHRAPNTTKYTWHLPKYPHIKPKKVVISAPTNSAGMTGCLGCGA